MTGLLAALQFLTRFPIRLVAAPDMARAVPWFPVVGALVGVLVGGVAAGLSELVAPAAAASVAVLVGVAATGAFHEDGLADTFDALGAHTPERRREILKDSRHGSFGVAALCGSILVRVVCLASLAPAAAFAGAVASHTLGRTGSVIVMVAAPPAPAEGLGADFMRNLRVGPVLAGALAGFGIAAFAVGWWVLPLAAVTAVVVAVGGTYFTTRFEGISGDLLGAIEQLVEIAVLVTITGLAARHSLWWS